MTRLVMHYGRGGGEVPESAQSEAMVQITVTPYQSETFEQKSCHVTEKY